MAKVLSIEYQKCTGCRSCELVCSVKHDGVANPMRSRIKVMKWEAEGLYIPMSCQQCQDAPCIAVCPTKALSRDAELGRVVVDYDKCIGCKLCITACPFGGMGFDDVDRKMIKCDFCDGDPACVSFCSTGAIAFEDASDVSLKKKKEAIKNLPVSMMKYKIF